MQTKLAALSPCKWDVGSRFTNKCRPSKEDCSEVCAPTSDDSTCKAETATCDWVTTTESPIFNMDDWRVMDWKGRTQAQRSDTCRNFFVNHARRVTGSDDIRGVLGLFGARLEFEQENFDAYDCKGMSEGMKAHGGCVETTNLADELKQYYTDGAAQQQFAVVDGAAGSGTALQFNAEMKEAYEKSVSFDPTASTTDKIKGRKLFMEVLLAAHEELMMREIMRGGVATGLKSATLQFSTATKDMMDCDCFINDDAIFVCDPAPWVPDSMHGQYADHALVLIGWGEQAGVPYWIGKNSWGSAWGVSGYF
jgi:hypothetical protein